MAELGVPGKGNGPTASWRLVVGAPLHRIKAADQDTWLRWATRACLAVAFAWVVATCASFHWYPSCNQDFASSWSGDVLGGAAISAGLALLVAIGARRPLAAFGAILLLLFCGLLLFGWSLSGLRDSCG